RAERAIEGEPEPAPLTATSPEPTHQKLEPSHPTKESASSASAAAPRPLQLFTRDRLLIALGLAVLMSGLLTGVLLARDRSDPWFCFIDRENRPRCFQTQAACEGQLKTQGGVTGCRIVRSLDLAP